MMDDWCLAWRPGCDIAWDAWVALATFAAVLAAIWVAGNERRDRLAGEYAEAAALSGIFRDEVAQVVAILKGMSKSFGLQNAGSRSVFVHFLETGQFDVRAQYARRVEFLRLPDMERLMSRTFVLPGIALDAVRQCRFELIELKASANIISTLSDYGDDDRPEIAVRVPQTVLGAIETLGQMAKIFDSVHEQCRNKLPNPAFRLLR